MMTLHEANHYIAPRLQLLVGILEHAVGFADSRRHTEEDLVVPAGLVTHTGNVPQRRRSSVLFVEEVQLSQKATVASDCVMITLWEEGEQQS